MACEVRRKLRADDQIDRSPVAFAQIEQPLCSGMREDLFFRVPLERHAHELGFKTACPQFPYQLTHVDLGATVDEGHLRLANEHGLDRLHQLTKFFYVACRKLMTSPS